MKHSDPGPMSDPGDCSVRSLCVDLCSLIAESRVPGLDERGYGAGVHCPPLIGPPRHACDLTQPECQKHQTIIHHLLEAAASNIFQIEVLLLPECCSESKLKECIENKDYILMERWSVNFIQGKIESNIDISQLLRAVRSFLHFSQLSAWFSSTNGKSPANICYWVNPDLETLCTKFKEEPEVHSFPLCKMNEDLYGTVKVEFPARTQYIPIVPCSKHPPICRHSLREINKDSNVCQSLSDSQMVRQLHKTSDTEQNTLATINYVPEPTILMLPPSSFLKTLTTAISDGSKAKRVLKHSNSQENLSNSTNMSIDTKSKNIDIIPKKSSFVCNYAETLSLGVSQENFCCNKRKLARHLRKTELKFKKLKKDSSSLDSEGLTPILPPDVYKLNQNVMKPSVQIMDVHKISNFLKAKNNTSSLIPMESSLVNMEDLFPNSLNKNKKLRNSSKAFKRKVSCQNEDNVDVLPNAKLSCDINISLQIPKDPSAITFTTSHPQYIESSQLKEKVTPLKEVHKEFIKHSSFAIPSYCSNDAKMLDMNHQQCSKYLSFTNSSDRDSLLTRKRPHLGNFENSHTNELFDRLIISQIQKQSKVNVSIYNPELKLSKRKCTSHLDSQTNMRGQIKPLDEYNNSLNLHSDSTSNISEAYISEINRTCSNLNDSIKISSEENVLNVKKLEKHNPTVQFSRSCTKSNTMCNDSNHIQVNNASSSNIQESNSSGKKSDCIMKSHIRKKKLLSRNYCKKSLTKIKSQKTNLRRSYRLLLASDQIPFDKSLEKPSNSNHEHATEMKYVPLCKSSCEIPCMLEAKLEQSPIPSKEKLSKNTESVDVSIKQNPVIKVRKEKAVHKDLKLTKLFKFKKAYSQISSERKNSSASTIKQLPLHKISDSSPLVNTVNSSSRDCKGNFSSSNNVNKLIINPLLQNDCSATNLPNSCKASKGINMKNDNISTGQFESSMNTLKMNTLQSDTQNSIPSISFRNVYRGTNENFVKRTVKFSKSKNLLMNFEESILKGCLPVVNNVKGFHAEIGASGSFCPSHLTLPADVSFYELGHSNQGTFPYVAHVSLKNSEYYLPKKGAVQVTLFNPSETVVKMFVLNYDLSSMPPLCHTFIRQKTYFLPVGINKENPTSQKWLRFIIHLRFASSKTGRITLHEDFKIVVLNKTNDDAASEFSQEPRELCSFISVPMNPTFSAI